MKKYLVCCFMLLSSSVFAQEIDLSALQAKLTSTGDNEFNAMDANGDGNVSKEEYLNYILAETMQKSEAAFNQIAQAGNGSGSHEEYMVFMNFATGKMNSFFNLLKQHQQ